jgi:hypothetical protein
VCSTGGSSSMPSRRPGTAEAGRLEQGCLDKSSGAVLIPVQCGAQPAATDGLQPAAVCSTGGSSSMSSGRPGTAEAICLGLCAAHFASAWRVSPFT